MKTDYVAETSTEPRLRAWLMPEDPDDEIEDPRILRPGGWRLQIETVDDIGRDGLVRSAWDETIDRVLSNMERYWPTRPDWRVHQTGETIDLYSMLEIEWRPDGMD